MTEGNRLVFSTQQTEKSGPSVDNGTDTTPCKELPCPPNEQLCAFQADPFGLSDLVIALLRVQA